jgi:hypothetical protein
VLVWLALQIIGTFGQSRIRLGNYNDLQSPQKQSPLKVERTMSFTLEKDSMVNGLRNPL